MAAKSESNAIHLTRVYDAPVESVWEAWTDPDQVTQWWGPRGFTLTTHSRDFRPGGHWDYTMHGPDGTDYPNRTKYLEIQPLTRMVYDHGATVDRPPLFRVTVVFSRLPGSAGTRMEMTMTLATPEAAEETRRFIKRAGGNATWDRLGEHLTERRSGKQCFVINRSFAAPIARVYEAWTKPDQLARWLPPRGMAMKVLRGELREGGSVFVEMKGDAGMLYGQFTYLELRAPARIVYAQQFTDATGRVARHPFAPKWPETMRTTVTLTEEGPDATRVTVETETGEGTTAEELRVFVAERGGMTQGWTGSFDALEAWLER